MDSAQDAAKQAARLIKKRDEIASRLAVVDDELKLAVQDYSRAMRIWGFTPLMMRQVCKARGLIT